jgi:hypothetical protein
VQLLCPYLKEAQWLVHALLRSGPDRRCEDLWVWAQSQVRWCRTCWHLVTIAVSFLRAAFCVPSRPCQQLSLSNAQVLFWRGLLFQIRLWSPYSVSLCYLSSFWVGQLHVRNAEFFHLLSRPFPMLNRRGCHPP